ncbi:MAG TPA: YdcH family protein [Azoarcus taiwanensis]|nr:YdcH family protein [Azoarcus taiwanensis]
MFPEYRDLITRLKHNDRHFTHLFEKHNELDHKIHNIETHVVPGTDLEVEVMKKEKLAIKDQIYAYLKKVETES